MRSALSVGDPVPRSVTWTVCGGRGACAPAETPRRTHATRETIRARLGCSIFGLACVKGHWDDEPRCACRRPSVRTDYYSIGKTDGIGHPQAQAGADWTE